MLRVALKMLLADQAKFLGLVFTIAFSSFLLVQQLCMFCGILNRTTSQIRAVQDANIWVMDPSSQYIDEIKPLSDTDVFRIRSVPGVAWAVPFSKNLAILKAMNGQFRAALVLGLDDASLVGGPPKMIIGNIGDLDQVNAIIMDKGGYNYFFSHQPYKLGQEFEINDKRVVLVGICDAPPPFQTFPVIYTKYKYSLGFLGQTRREMSFVLAKELPGFKAEDVCKNITRITGLKSYTREEYRWVTIWYYLKNTGIPVNFGLTISIAVLVGAVVAGQTFYIFTLENLQQFGTLKAIGVSHSQVIGMVLLQALTVTVLGYGFGMGMAGIFFTITEHNMATRGFVLLWQTMVMTAAVMLMIGALTSILSLRKVLQLEPASVFRG
jgi:putative ABC transport system permease protein